MTDTTDTNDVTGNSIADLLKVATAHAVPVVRAIPDDRLAAPTPCVEYDVKALVNHLLQVIVQFQALAAKQNSEFGAEAPDLVAGNPDWRDLFADEAGKLVAAWSAPGAEEGTTGAMDMPARTVACMVLLDLTVHAWDLARATGQKYEAAPESSGVVAVLRESVAGLGPTARKMGVFGEPVAVPEGAGELERLLAETGRDPRWTP
ncbi:TIGR03086 family metal-binding protein [Streptomyces sp. NPDC058257]|uniref:TIGR03086 family metal-binding protein n=1 Tax=Streptomyces sp. NPDC058257 TaxID=3346409 RepID=UPI0036E3E848